MSQDPIFSALSQPFPETARTLNDPRFVPHAPAARRAALCRRLLELLPPDFVLWRADLEAILHDLEVAPIRTTPHPRVYRRRGAA